MDVVLPHSVIDNYSTEIVSELESHTPYKKCDEIFVKEHSPKGQLIRSVVSHCTKFNQSYKCLENTANLINSTPGAKIRIPSTMYTIKKQVPLLFEPEYYIQCAPCKSYSTIECELCGKQLKRANSKYFVYIPLKPQLIKSIHDHFNEIITYDKNFIENSDLIRDMQDGLIYKNVRAKYPNSVILPLVENTDGAKIFKSTIGSIWPLQLLQCFLKPNTRQMSENIILVGLHEGKIVYIP